ncbi:otoancorin isoform X2 [Amia ocellicauda]|uniref:otoancorin isoform X2 n=1 Tax=Amia ocellicauda TaxID=2972642 RepID=UPI0034642B66
MAKSQILLSLLLMSLGTPSLSVSGGPQKPVPAAKCSGWETKLVANLSSPQTFPQFLKDNAQTLSALSASCVTSFHTSVDRGVLATLLNALNKVYDGLNPGTKQALYNWVQQVSQTQNATKPPGPKGWITVEVLQVLGRFILQAPQSTLEGIVGNTDSPLCKLFKNGTDIWDRLYDLNSGQAELFLDGFKSCGIDVTNQTVFSKLGQLTCFFDRVASKIRPADTLALVAKLKTCTRNVKDLYQKLISGKKNITVDDVMNMGESAVGLSVAQLKDMDKDKVKQLLPTLMNVTGWKDSQKKALLDQLGEVTARNLSSLGYLASGIEVKKLKTMNSNDLLEAMKNKEVSKSTDDMNPVQKKTIIQEVLRNKSMDETLKDIPPGLVSEISAASLKKASNASLSLDFLNKSFPWNKGQALIIVKKIWKNLKTKEDFNKLTTAVTGLTCGIIKNLSMENLRTLAQNSNFTRDQIRCGSKAYFDGLWAIKPFANLTNDDISQIPPSFLLFSPVLPDLMKVNGSVDCSSLVAVLTKADPQLLPLSSGRRNEVLNFIKTCWNISDTSAITLDQLAKLGTVVCYFKAADINSLTNTVFKAAVQQLNACGNFKGGVKQSIAAKIKSTYGDVSAWTTDVVNELQLLLSVLERNDLGKINKTMAVKTALSDILSTLKSPQGFVPGDLDFTPDVSAMREILASIILNTTLPTSARRRRDTCTVVPTIDQITALGAASTSLSASALSCMSTDTFTNTMDILAPLTGLSLDQLTALKNKAQETFGTGIKSQLANLKRIVVAFNEPEVKSYFDAPDIDTLAASGPYADWVNTTILPKAQIIVGEFLVNNTIPSLGSSDLVGLGYFLCAFSAAQVKQISATAFSTAAQNIGTLQCPTDTMVALKDKAKEAFGDPSTWTEDTLQELGTITSALTASEISTLPNNVMSYLTPKSVSLIPGGILNQLSLDQLRNLGTENYAAVSAEQRSKMDASKLQALDENSGTRATQSTSNSAIINNLSLSLCLSLVLLAVLH